MVVGLSLLSKLVSRSQIKSVGHSEVVAEGGGELGVDGGGVPQTSSGPYMSSSYRSLNGLLDPVLCIDPTHS
jgi:hypothetical protein